MRHLGRALLIYGLFCVGLAPGADILLKDGRTLHGKLGRVSSLADSLQTMRSDGEKLQQILFLDDELRRTFFSERLVREVLPEEKRQAEEKYALHQRVLRSGPSIASVGSPISVQPFDEHGRRIYTMSTFKGPLEVIQGITELTPEWTKVEGITHVWDMRMATSSIPRDVLAQILWKQIDPKRAEDYKKAARFYLQCERYEEARETLEKLLGEMPDLKEQLEPSLRAIRQLAAQRLLAELRLRREAGQHRLAADMLARFPTEGVGGEILQGGRDMLRQLETERSRSQSVVEHLKTLSAQLAETIQRDNLGPILEEMAEEIGPNTLPRMAAFLQNADDPKMSDAQKVSLAISGWLLGADSATVELSRSISAFKVRGFIFEYLRETKATELERTFSYIRQESAGDPATAALLLQHMKPAWPAPKPSPDAPGFYTLEAPGPTKDSEVTYHIQLPPEYDPYRSYPAIVALGGQPDARRQIDWWAGLADKDGRRNGQAMRHGYIVIAPQWSVKDQARYGYSAREHAAVLNSLRDACRRFSIDADRVYLAGHGIGGDAVWDIALAHPDLWAGAIPISAQADRYCARYWENARYVPFYVVLGELDGARLTKNAMDLDRYLRRGFNTTVVEYRGRGFDDFYDEILRLFDWMGRFRRDFYPREFDCVTMRPWDNFFWWVEVEGLPPRSTVDPADWPPASNVLPVQVRGSLNKTNGVNVRTGAGHAVVWLSPKMVDFNLRSTITVNGRRFHSPDQMIRPDLRVMLDDVRTRGDRQHPFWARVEGPTGRGRVGDSSAGAVDR